MPDTFSLSKLIFADSLGAFPHFRANQTAQASLWVQFHIVSNGRQFKLQY